VQIHEIQNCVQVIFRPIIRTDKTYVGCKNQISLLQVQFSRHLSSLFGCMSSVKTRLASVRLSQVYIPYSAQLRRYSFVIIRISILLENI